MFGLDGSFVRQWGEEGDGVGQFVSPEGIGVGESEVFVSCNNRVQVFRLHNAATCVSAWSLAEQ